MSNRKRLLVGTMTFPFLVASSWVLYQRVFEHKPQRRIEDTMVYRLGEQQAEQQAREKQMEDALKAQMYHQQQQHHQGR